MKLIRVELGTEDGDWRRVRVSFECLVAIAADNTREGRSLAGWCKTLEGSDSSVVSSESMIVLKSFRAFAFCPSSFVVLKFLFELSELKR